ncbi:MAG: S41 family peptidase [Lachnospiraceae bacterium]|jgi:carboxyl-terminal processing protease|nr:S41 family peptidase [Lachnospiraceae bacterium]
MENNSNENMEDSCIPQFGTANGQQPVAQSGTQPGTQFDAQSGAQPGAQSDAQPWAQSVTAAGPVAAAQAAYRTAPSYGAAGSGAGTAPQRSSQTDGRPHHMSGRIFFGGFLSGLLVAAVLLSLAAVIGLRSGTLLRFAEQAGASAETSGSSPAAAQTADSSSAINNQSVSKLQQLESLIDSKYYYADDVTVQQKEDGMYSGLLKSLDDPYSVYYNADELKDLNASSEGVFYGIGAYVTLDQETQYPLITGTVKDSPAEKAGLQAGDIIYKVDGTDVAGKDLDEVVNMIHGKEGTKVKLTIYRKGAADYIQVEITRAKQSSTTVYSEMQDGKIGYIGITEFDDVTSDQFATALADLKAQGMKGLIIDLRGNPGGNVTTVTAIAQQILPKGLIFYWEERNGEKTEFDCDGSNELQVPLTVLVNQYSASASEILSGAIQDSGIGTVIGTQTYGKGVVQDVYDLKDGTAVKLTVAAYFTRNGRDINHKGITPDIALDFDTDAYASGTDNQLEEAQKVLKEKIDGTFDLDSENASISASADTASSAETASTAGPAGIAATSDTASSAETASSADTASSAETSSSADEASSAGAASSSDTASSAATGSSSDTASTGKSAK